jgi:phage head maturation protease
MRTLLTRSADSPIIHRSADLSPSSFDPTDNSLEVIWTTGAPVQRVGFFMGPFIETLEVSAAALRLGRLDAGAAVLDSHDMYELSAAIGSVVPGSVRIANGQGTARIRLADTPDVADTVAKIRAGHLRNVSVGYLVHTYERLAGDEGELDELRAIDWEPTEISFVTVPADPGAQVRLEESDMTRIIEGGNRRSRAAAAAPAPTIINRDGAATGMDNRSDQRGEARDHGNEQRDRHEERGAYTARGRDVTENRIREMCDRANFSRDFERTLLAEHMRTPLSEAQLIRSINDEFMARQGDRTVDARAGGDASTGGDGMARAMEDALFARMSGQTPTQHAREFMGVRMLDMARGLLEQQGQRVRWSSASAVVDTMTRFGAHTTSDFPNILGNAARRYLLQVLNEFPAPLRPIVHPRTATDFRRISLVKLGLNPALLVVPENGEIKRGTTLDAAEGYALTTYARIFAITRQALINDDLGAFVALFQGWARAAAELEASLIAGLIMANPTMSDGYALYSPQHHNLAASGSAINVASLTAGRQAVRLQKDLDGSTIVGAVPKFLVVGAAKETEAEQALSAIQAAAVSDVNPFSGKLTLLVDPRITGNSWRLFADPAAFPVIEIARLEGQEDVFVDTRVGFDVDGIESKARVDIGGAAVDYRGTYMDPGN